VLHFLLGHPSCQIFPTLYNGLGNAPPPKIALSPGDPGCHLIRGSLGPPKSTHTKWHLHCFCCFSTAQCRDSLHNYAVERGLAAGFCGQPHYCYRHYRQSGFDLPRHTWSLMNRFRTGQGPSCANLHQWGLAQQNLEVDRIYSMLLMGSSNPRRKKCLFGEGSSTWVCPGLHLVIILNVVFKGAAVMQAVFCTVYFIMCAKFVIDQPFHSTSVVIVILSTRCCKKVSYFSKC